MYQMPQYNKYVRGLFIKDAQNYDEQSNYVYQSKKKEVYFTPKSEAGSTMPSTAAPTLREKNTSNRIDGILKSIALNTVEGETHHPGLYDDMEQLKKIKMLSRGAKAANQQNVDSNSQKKEIWKYCHKKNSLSKTNSNLKGLFSQSISNDVSAGDLLSVRDHEINSKMY